jgi:hypothetical protein
MVKTKINYRSYITILVFLTLSCQNNSDIKKIDFDSFPEEKAIDGKICEMKKLPLRLYQIEIVDSLIVAFDFYRKDKRLFIFNANNFNLIEDAGVLGNGPKELSRPFFFDINKKNRTIWIGDRGKLKIFGFSIKSIIQSEKKRPSFECNISKNIKKNFTRIRYYNDSLFAITSYISKGKLHLVELMNRNGKIVDSLGVYPQKRKKNEPKFGFSMLWEHNIRVLDNKNLLISFRNYDKIMQIDSNGNTVFISSGPDHIKQKRMFHKNKIWIHLKDASRGYGTCYKYNNYFYCLYSGESFFINDNYNTRQLYYKHIHIFDDKGKPVIKYNLNHEIRDFVIDKKNNRIVGISTSTPEPFIIFPLPKIK